MELEPDTASATCCLGNPNLQACLAAELMRDRSRAPVQIMLDEVPWQLVPARISTGRTERRGRFGRLCTATLTGISTQGQTHWAMASGGHLSCITGATWRDARVTDSA